MECLEYRINQFRCRDVKRRDFDWQRTHARLGTRTQSAACSVHACFACNNYEKIHVNFPAAHMSRGLSMCLSPAHLSLSHSFSLLLSLSFTLTLAQCCGHHCVCMCELHLTMVSHVLPAINNGQAFMFMPFDCHLLFNVLDCLRRTSIFFVVALVRAHLIIRSLFLLQHRCGGSLPPKSFGHDESCSVCNCGIGYLTSRQMHVYALCIRCGHILQCRCSVHVLNMRR